MDQESVFDLTSNSERHSDWQFQHYGMRGRSEELQTQSQHVREHLQSLANENNLSFVNPLKSLVSKKKNRFIMDGFDLDLTYITEQIIAMGFPAIDYESIYRNSMEDVQKFFKMRHKGHYKIINLCSERKYDHSFFDGNVSEYPFEDHQPPPLRMIYELCADIHKFLNQDKQNVVAIHCKAGKGRTGVMICCYLLYSKMFETSYEVMRYYGMMRTKNKKGVTIPSQIRYILYFEKALQSNYTLTTLPHQQLRIMQLRMLPIPIMGYMCNPQISINNQIFTKFSCIDDSFIIFNIDIIVIEDVKLQCHNKTLLTKELLFEFWFHTSFIDQNGLLIIDKYMLDRAVKDKKHKIFQPNFRVELQTVFEQLLQ